MPSTIETLNPAIYQEVHDIAHRFVEAMLTGKSSNMKPFYHENARSFGTVAGTYINGDNQKVFDLVDAGILPKDVKVKNTIVGLTETTAVVHMEKGTAAPGSDGSDFITFVKRDGKWGIVNKVFNGYGAWFE